MDMKAGRAPAKGSFMENQTARFIAPVPFRLCSALCHDLKIEDPEEASCQLTAQQGMPFGLWDWVAGAATGLLPALSSGAIAARARSCWE